jgi:hypothetical protein
LDLEVPLTSEKLVAMTDSERTLERIDDASRALLAEIRTAETSLRVLGALDTSVSNLTREIQDLRLRGITVRSNSTQADLLLVCAASAVFLLFVLVVVGLAWLRDVIELLQRMD